VHCFRQAQPESCYQQALSDAFDHAAQPYAAQLGDVLADEKTSFLAQNPFAQSQAKVTQFYSLVFAGIEPAVTASAGSRWDTCLNAPSQSGPASSAQAGSSPLVTPFSGGTHYVATDLLNCINSSFDGDLRSVRDAFIARLGLSVSDPDLQVLIQNMLLPGYLDTLKSKEDAAATAEDADRDRRKPGVLDVLSTQLTRDLTWLGAALTSDAAVAQCLPAATAAFNDYFGRVSASEQLPTRFAALEDVRTSWTHDACVQVVAGPAVTQVLQQRSQEAWTAATSALESAVLGRARDTATDCIARNPSPARFLNAVVKQRRRSCLTATQTWSTIEAQAMADWGRSAEGKSFAVSRKSDALAYLAAHRKALQARAIAAMESGH
jgi:hypothetical protein